MSRSALTRSFSPAFSAAVVSDCTCSRTVIPLKCRLAAVRPKVATFDCYGTLVDWEGGIGAFLYALLLREGVEDPPPGRELRKRWEEIQFERVRGPYKPYKEILAEATVAWCREMGIDDAHMY